jgi:hypothetical protein
MTNYLHLIDTSIQGPRYDVTPLFTDYRAFVALLDDFQQRLAKVQFDLVAGIDALGFILGTALALRVEKGLVPIRKGGKLPVMPETYHPETLRMLAGVTYIGTSKKAQRELGFYARPLEEGLRETMEHEMQQLGMLSKIASTPQKVDPDRRGDSLAWLSVSVGVARCRQGRKSVMDHLDTRTARPSDGWQVATTNHGQHAGIRICRRYNVAAHVYYWRHAGLQGHQGYTQALSRY